jgi:CheY-like chemotaxis protein
MISTGAGSGMRKCILVVAQQIELRVRIARVLQSAGYAVELAESQKRALEVASGGQIEAAIVVPSTDLAGLERELRDKVPRTIVLGHRTDEVMRQDHSVRGEMHFRRKMHFRCKHWTNRSFSINSADRRHRQGARAARLPLHRF